MVLNIDEDFKQNFLNQMRRNIIPQILKSKDNLIWNKSQLDNMYHIFEDLLYRTPSIQYRKRGTKGSIITQRRNPLSIKRGGKNKTRKQRK
jgi:hypothetical protein